jgi:thiol-disulfide isomerase/thioredoxin
MNATALASRCLSLVGAAVLALTASMVFGADALLPWTGGLPPPISLKTIGGQEVTLDAYRGRTVVVNFWATWCAPCVAEMPSLQRMRDKLAPKGIEVIAVNLQENAARIGPFVERLGITFPVVRDHDGAVRTAWQVTVFPTSFVVGPDQRIVWVARGEIDWDDAHVQSQLRTLH